LDDLDGGIAGGLADESGNAGVVFGVFGDDKDGGAGSAEGYTEDSGSAGEGQEAAQKGAGLHAVGLVDAVLHGGAEEVGAVEGEGGDEERGGLDVGDGVGAGVCGGEEGSGFFCGEAGGWQG